MRQDANVVNRIKEVQSFPSLLKFLRDDLDWPITSDDVEDLTFDYSPDELGFDKKMAVKVRSIKQLRPLVKDQPWGIFYIDFEPKRLPVGALRRLLRSLVVKKRGGGDGSQATWNLDDLLFISFHGEESRRTVAFAHFHERDQKQPQLRTFYWDQGETEFASVLESLGKLNWPQYAGSAEMAHVWRQYWGAAFRVGHGEVIRDSKALSKKLAQVALKIRQHVFDLLDAEDADKGPLHRLFASFKKALLHDLDEQRFADVLAQTFTYGLLAAKAEIGTKTPLEPGHLAEQIPATNPLLRELFEEFQHLTGVGLDKLDEDLGDLGVDELVDLLNTVDVDEALKNFGRTTMSGQEDPVVHFYEEFLKDYDKEQKVERGVFYTPKPVVSFIVRSVHEILQKEFGLEDGLASTATWDDMVAKHEGLAKPEGIRGDEPFVQILDPAVGTGTFLEACIQLIYDTMAAKWNRAGKDVKAEWNRYVPEHLLPRLHGFELMMAPYVVCHMKLAMRLKELGYDFSKGERLRVYLTNSLEPGRPDQTEFATMVPSVAHEAYAANVDKLQKHFTIWVGNPPYSVSQTENNFALGLVAPYKQGLNETKSDLNREEWKFTGFAQSTIDKLGAGAVGFVINRSFVDGVTHRRMRESLQDTFEWQLLLDLNGDVKGRRLGTAEEKDANVFDIEQGVAIFVLAKGTTHRQRRYGSLVGAEQRKYDWLREALPADCAQESNPAPPYFFWHPFGAGHVEAFTSWPSVTALFPVYSSGIQTKNDGLTIHPSQGALLSFLAEFDQCPLSQVGSRFNVKLDGAWSAQAAKADVRDSAPWLRSCHEMLYRPFDKRWTLWTGRTGGFHGRPRREVMQHLIPGGNLGLMFNRQITGESVSHFAVTDCICCHGTFYLGNKGQDYVAPLWLVDEGGLLGESHRSPNLSAQALSFLSQSFDQAELSSAQIEAFLYYTLAVLSSPTYRTLFDEQLRVDFPRVPLSTNRPLFVDLVELGEKVADRLLLRSGRVGNVKYVGPQNPLVERPTYNPATMSLGIGGIAEFEGVSERAAGFSLGGYVVAEKWLKDRRGERLSDVDVRHFEHVLEAMDELAQLALEIDAVVEAHGGWPGAFQQANDEVAS